MGTITYGELREFSRQRRGVAFARHVMRRWEHGQPNPVQLGIEIREEGLHPGLRILQIRAVRIRGTRAVLTHGACTVENEHDVERLDAAW